ncbi:hypothetical protein BDZ89DRAFT_1123379 [Hymenopellis radicata]|nr:hypothetical protein BDZ89DRAFT_1123379 [Hymenopellis radicata]
MSDSAIADTSDFALNPLRKAWTGGMLRRTLHSTRLVCLLMYGHRCFPTTRACHFPEHILQADAQARCDAEETDARRRQTRGWTRHEEEADVRIDATRMMSQQRGQQRHHYHHYHFPHLPFLIATMTPTLPSCSVDCPRAIARGCSLSMNSGR